MPVVNVGSNNQVLNIAFTDAYTSTTNIPLDVNLSSAKKTISATTVGNYALFGSGNNSTCDAIDSSFTRTTITAMSYPSELGAAETIGNYAIFCGKVNGDIYNSALTRSTKVVLTSAKTQLASTVIGNYALFGGGARYDNSVDAINSSLTKSSASSLSVGRYWANGVNGAASIGSYALFAGGYHWYNSDDRGNRSEVATYNTSLTKGTATALSVAVQGISGATVGNYAIFSGQNCGNENG